MKKLREETMNRHDTEFKLLTRETPVGPRTDLYKVVNGTEIQIMSLDNMKQGIDYLENHYLKDWMKFREYADALTEAIRKNIFLFDFDEYGVTESARYIDCVVGGEVIKTKVMVIINVGHSMIQEVKVDWLEIMNNPGLEYLANQFAIEWVGIIEETFKMELVS